MNVKNLNRRDFLKGLGIGTASFVLAGGAGNPKQFALRTGRRRPNILWIMVEDMSPHMGCYGETTIETPNIDRLAAEGVLFKNAFATSPVCSPSRSAAITGMYQTTIGAHNQRSSFGDAIIYLPKNVRLLPEYFKDAGYFTVLGGPKKTVYHKDLNWNGRNLGKADYNFFWDPAVYDSDDWKGRKPGQPFFAQIQLHGGKARKAEVSNPADPAKVKLPPQYPYCLELCEDWAKYLNSVIKLDNEVADILKRLDDEGIADNTVVVLWTDQGMYHVRGKQFLYDEGIRIPLIIRWPGVLKAGTIREDMVSHIDVSATSLYFAGIGVPGYIEGRPLFGPGYRQRDYIIAARDRCGKTVDRIRCVRTKRYKYIRNFYPERPHAQPNKYADSRYAMKVMRKLQAEGKLNAVQARVFEPTRPEEELYDVVNDPHEIDNLAKVSRHHKTLKRMRAILDKWIEETGDKGQFPEDPIVDS
ncbi:MAG: sulfatase-like hydrolase/transferase [Planctomycetota bacterium]|jgi:arylsulfatase A-like enzyme